MKKTPQSTLIAKSLYKLGGQLSRIPTYSRGYEVNKPVDLDLEDPIEFTCIGRNWTRWQFGYTMALKWSYEWDYKHWDHWALVHDKCGWQYCNDCKGRICGGRGEEL